MRIALETACPPQSAVAIARDTGARGESDLSFSELLEAGAAAGAIAGNRALGFSETGIMGLHFAMGASGAAPVGGSEASVTNAKTSGVEGLATPSSNAAQALLGADMRAGAARGGSAPAAIDRHTAAAGNGPLGANARANGNRPFGANEDRELETLPRSRFAKPILAERSAAKKQVSLIADGEAVTIMADGFGQEDETRHELDKMTREVAAEFGVTINKLIVRSSSSTTK